MAARFRGDYKLKDLLVELIMSPWFRAVTGTSGDPTRQKALASAGTERLLTPEQLERKTRAVTGLSWGGWKDRQPATWTGTRRSSGLTYEYRQFYGGIDSDGVTKRATELNAIMASVAQTHAAEMSCPIVMRELVVLPTNKRVLFRGIDRYVTPLTDFSAQHTVNGASFSQRTTYSQTGDLSGNVRIKAFFANYFYDPVTQTDRNLMLDRLVVRDANSAVVYSFEYKNCYIDGSRPLPNCQHSPWGNALLPAKRQLHVRRPLRDATGLATSAEALVPEKGFPEWGAPKCRCPNETTRPMSRGGTDMPRKPADFRF